MATLVAGRMVEAEKPRHWRKTLEGGRTPRRAVMLLFGFKRMEYERRLEALLPKDAEKQETGLPGAREVVAAVQRGRGCDSRRTAEDSMGRDMSR